MPDSRVKNTLRSTYVGFIKIIVTYVGQFVVRALLVKRLGYEYAGLDSIFTSILSVLSITELGIGSAMCYFMYKPIAENDQKSINAFANLNRKLCRWIGVAITVIGLVIMPALSILINKDVPDDINIYLLYMVFLLNAAESYFLYAYTVSIVNAYQRNDLENKSRIFSNVIKYGFQIFALLVFRNYWIYTIILPISTVLGNIYRCHLLKVCFPEVKCEGRVSESVTREIKKQVIALFGHRLNGTLIRSADDLVISAFIGLSVLGKYSNYYYIYVALDNVIDVFYNAVRSSVGHQYITGDRDKIYEMFTAVSFGIQWISGWASISLMCLYKPFISLWIGTDGLLSTSTSVLLSVLLYETINFELFTVYKDAAGLWWDDRFRPYTAAIANLVINIILINVIGLNGVIISTLATRVLISWPWISKVLFDKVLKRKMSDYYARFMINTVAIGGVGLLTCFIATELSFGNNLIQLTIRAIVCMVIPNLLLLVIFHGTADFKYCKKKIFGIIHRT